MRDLKTACCLKKCGLIVSLVVGLGSCFATAPVQAQNNQDLALQLADPLADLVSLPYQFDYDSGFSLGDGAAYVGLFQAVVPFDLGSNWKVISRTGLPVIQYDSNWVGDAADDAGIGDISQSFLFTPKGLGPGDLRWGVGPTFRFPTATEDSIGRGQFAVGPTAVVVRQGGQFTYGAMASHLRSVGGSDFDRRRINSTQLHPFFSLTTSQTTTFELSSESSYDWDAEEWTVPVIFQLKKMINLGGRPMQISAGAKYWATSPERSADGWGLRFGLTFLLP